MRQARRSGAASTAGCSPMLWEADLRRRGQIRPGHRLWYSWYRLWRLAGPDWEPAPWRRPDPLLGGGTGATDSTMGWAEWVAGDVTVRRSSRSHWGGHGRGTASARSRASCGPTWTTPLARRSA